MSTNMLHSTHNTHQKHLPNIQSVKATKQSSLWLALSANRITVNHTLGKPNNCWLSAKQKSYLVRPQLCCLHLRRRLLTLNNDDVHILAREQCWFGKSKRPRKGTTIIFEKRYSRHQTDCLCKKLIISNMSFLGNVRLKYCLYNTKCWLRLFHFPFRQKQEFNREYKTHVRACFSWTV